MAAVVHNEWKRERRRNVNVMENVGSWGWDEVGGGECGEFPPPTFPIAHETTIESIHGEAGKYKWKLKIQRRILNINFSIRAFAV